MRIILSTSITRTFEGVAKDYRSQKIIQLQLDFMSHPYHFAPFADNKLGLDQFIRVAVNMQCSIDALGLLPFPGPFLNSTRVSTIDFVTQKTLARL